VATTTAQTMRIIDPAIDPAWRTLLATCPNAGLFHSPPWMQAIADGYGFAVRGCLVAAASGDPAGAVSYCELDDFVGRRIVSLPFSDACDPLLASSDTWPGLLAALQSHGVPVHLRCLNADRVPAVEGMQIVKKARWHRLSLDGTVDELWRRISPESRRSIRQSERASLEVRPLAGDHDRLEFHQLHVALRKTKYRLLAQPIQFFAAIEQRFHEVGAWHSLAAYLGPRMVAGVVYLRWGDTLYYKFNASAPDALRARPNNRLVWEGVRLAKSQGCRYLDLGPSDDDQPGLIRFKRDFGAEESEVAFLRWTPKNWTDHPERRQLLAEFTRDMTAPAVSNQVAASAGAAFYPFFA
jgi:CelD/BcsL family acetyltransferase involved in cellulose biosynthesis